ncbi:TBC domain containing protein [Tritrichomonas foetus]|uniref:TBC domain containing protein n=1 Tax=Tritrichomonas foetus TaxID=1144522 RepID=A0A1J4K8Y9_9EUKA|nr:TBC domain containing protein [Tritrichomonas foetus]|eukprot:OHT06142.1 TBC domain containing protein [Tritrichomonas foetus]
MNLKMFDFFSFFRASNSENQNANKSDQKPKKITPPSLARVQITDPIPHAKKSNKKSREKVQSQFSTVLCNTGIVDLSKLREITWVGIPDQYRSRSWRLLLDYEPTNSDQAQNMLNHKRLDYLDCRNRLLNQENLWTNAEHSTFRQISLDIPRTPVVLLRNERVSTLFKNVLFVWAVRHPASGYVQGMNDVLLPFFICFIFPHFHELSFADLYSKTNVDEIDDKSLDEIEADCFWCFSKLMDGIQDVYTKGQPGMYKMINNLEKVLQVASPEIYEWIEKEEISYINFTVRWFNCLIVREFNFKQLFRIWDMFVCDPAKISSKIVYVCASMVNVMAKNLINLPRHEFISKIQSTKPEFWTDDKIEMILAQSFVLEKNIVIDDLTLRV